MIIVWGRIHPRPTIVGWGVLLLLDKGKKYEFSNKEKLRSVKPGDITEVMISPSDPSKIITLDKRKNALGITVILTSFSILIGVIFLLDYKKDNENKMG